MRKSQYLALFHVANFSSSVHHVDSREEFALTSPNPQASSSPEDCCKILSHSHLHEHRNSRKRLLHKPGEAWGYRICGLQLPAPLPSSYNTIAVNPLKAHAKWIPTSAIVLGMKTSFEVSHAAKSLGTLSRLLKTAKPNHKTNICIITLTA